jgi:hypothetical protein
MRRSPHDLLQLPAALPAGEFPLDGAIAMELPEGWTLLDGGADCPPAIPGIASFAELADDEVVVTVITRDYSFGAERLLGEIANLAAGSDDRGTVQSTLHLRPGVFGRALYDADGDEEFFIAALVTGRPEDRAIQIGVEVVAAGPTGAVAARLPMLRTMVSTIGHR